MTNTDAAFVAAFDDQMNQSGIPDLKKSVSMVWAYPSLKPNIGVANYFVESL